MRVGVLGLQGGVEPHLRALRGCGFDGFALRKPEQLQDVDGLVLPGGESTAQRKLIARGALHEPLMDFVESGRPVLATCAGLILCSNQGYGWIDVDVSRNGWGTQRDSFRARDDADELELVFIRAPRIERVGSAVEVVATYRGEPVLVRCAGLHAATFHPELTPFIGLHQNRLSISSLIIV